MAQTKLERTLNEFKRLKHLEARKIANEIAQENRAEREKDKELQKLEKQIHDLQAKRDKLVKKYNCNEVAIERELRKQFDEWFVEKQIKVLTDNIDKKEIEEDLNFQFDVAKAKQVRL